MKNDMNTKLLFAASLMLFGAVEAHAIDIYVAKNGNDANRGTKDAPVATLNGARDLVRHYKSLWKQAEPIHVWIGEGDYYQESSFVLSGLDSGTADAPVVWSAMPGQRVSISGGVVVPPERFGRVTDRSVLRRLSPEAARHVVQADLRELGISDYGRIRQYGHTLSVAEAPLELFCDGDVMTLARYPNEGFMKIGKVIDAGSAPRVGDYSNRGGSFVYTDDRHARWAGQEDVWMQGTFNYGFADDNILVEKIDPKTRSVKLAFPHLYGVNSGNNYQQYYAYNILDELDSPGEWYLDRKTGKLYFWPPADVAEARVQVSILEDPIVCLEGVDYVRLENLTIECGRGIGVYIERSNHNLIAGCTVRNVGTNGIFMGQGARQTFPHPTVEDYDGVPVSRRIGNIKGHIYKYTNWNRRSGDNNGVLSCDIYNTGCGGVYLSGGDKVTLTPGNSYVENCKIHNYTRRNKFLWAAVNVWGCGNRVAHCEIYDSDWQGIFVSGNEHLFEYNHIHHVTLDSNDTSPWYIGRDPSSCGNVVRYNYFHDCGNPDRMTMGIYCDDSSADVTVFGNLFVDMRTNHGVMFSNSGWHLTFKNNIVVNPVASTFMVSSHYYTWAVQEGPHCFAENGLLRERLTRNVNIYAPPYSERYPWLHTYLDPIVEGKEWEGMRSRNNVAAGNLIVGGPEAYVVRTGPYAQCEDVDNLRTDDDPGFVDRKNGNYNLREDSEVFRKIKNFQPLPVDRMGLYVDQYRKSL